MRDEAPHHRDGSGGGGNRVTREKGCAGYALPVLRLVARRRLWVCDRAPIEAEEASLTALNPDAALQPGRSVEARIGHPCDSAD